MASFREIDAMNKQLKSWGSSPAFQAELEGVAEQFGIDLTASGRISKSKESQQDEAVDDFINWYRDNIGTRAEFQEQYNEELQEFETGDLGMSFDEFIESMSDFSAALTDAYEYDSDYTHTIHEAVKAGGLTEAEAAAALREMMGEANDNISNSEGSYQARVEQKLRADLHLW